MGNELALCRPVGSAAELPTTITGRHLGKTLRYLRKGPIPSCAKSGAQPGQVRTNHSPNPHHRSPEEPALLQSEAPVCKGPAESFLFSRKYLESQRLSAQLLANILGSRENSAWVDTWGQWRESPALLLGERHTRYTEPPHLIFKLNPGHGVSVWRASHSWSSSQDLLSNGLDKKARM